MVWLLVGCIYLGTAVHSCPSVTVTSKNARDYNINVAVTDSAGMVKVAVNAPFKSQKKRIYQVNLLFYRPDPENPGKSVFALSANPEYTLIRKGKTVQVIFHVKRDFLQGCVLRMMRGKRNVSECAFDIEIGTFAKSIKKMVK